jgi:hypothetical protein
MPLLSAAFRKTGRREFDVVIAGMTFLFHFYKMNISITVIAEI